MHIPQTLSQKVLTLAASRALLNLQPHVTGMEDANTLDLQRQSSSLNKPTHTRYKPLLIDTNTHSKCRMRQNLAKQ